MLSFCLCQNMQPVAAHMCTHLFFHYLVSIFRALWVAIKICNSLNVKQKKTFWQFDSGFPSHRSFILNKSFFVSIRCAFHFRWKSFFTLSPKLNSTKILQVFTVKREPIVFKIWIHILICCDLWLWDSKLGNDSQQGQGLSSMS